MKPERNEEEEKKSKEEDNFGSSPAHQPAPSPGTKQKEGGCACLYLLTRLLRTISPDTLVLTQVAETSIPS